MKTLAEIEIARIEWSSLRELTGTAEKIPAALLDLLSAPTESAANAAYWRLENHVVVQGQLFQAAEAVVSVLLAGLSQSRAQHIRSSVLELLFQILAGHPDESEMASNDGLGEACKAKAREGLWILYQEMAVGEREAAKECIELIETDKKRLQDFLDNL
jgi:hypothetical protein